MGFAKWMFAARASPNGNISSIVYAKPGDAITYTRTDRYNEVPGGVPTLSDLTETKSYAPTDANACPIYAGGDPFAGVLDNEWHFSRRFGCSAYSRCLFLAGRYCDPASRQYSP